MKIVSVDTVYICVPLKRKFKTSRRESGYAHSVLVRVCDSDGICGYGEAAVTPSVTGETRDSIEAAIRYHLAPVIIGRSLGDFNELLRDMNGAIYRNTSAKAAVDIALYDLKCRQDNITLRRFLGGGVNNVDSCLTISLNSPQEMAADSEAALKEGFKLLKLKLGGSIESDIERVSAVRKIVGLNCGLIVDANQGWGAKQAVKIISQMEDMGLGIELVEQPVAAWNFDAMRYVTKNVRTLIAADESVFTEHDASELLSAGAADIINIKLMKSGGIYGALKLCETAQAFGVDCMIGCMLEAGLAANAAAQLAAARPCIVFRDLDAPFLCAEYQFGGAEFKGGEIALPHTAGTGCDASNFFEGLA